MNIKANLILPDADKLMQLMGLDEGGKVQKYIDGFIFDHSEPYLPGYHLYRDSKSANNPGNGQVIWNTQDANYLYEGKIMVDAVTYSAWARPNTQKIMDPKNRDLHYHGGGLRDKKWFDHMINDKMDDLLNGIPNIINGGKHG